MTKKENITLKDIEQRKKRIEAELNQIQNKFMDGTSGGFRRSILSKIVPVEKIRENPLASVGIALAIGFLAGLPKSKSKEKKKEKEQEKHYGSNGQVRVSNLVFNELKRLMAKRAVNYFVDTVDTALSNRMHRTSVEPPPTEVEEEKAV